MLREIPLGSLSVPAIGLGTLRNKGEDGRALVEAGLDEGFRHIDTAQYYGNEDVVGRAVAASHVPRDDIWLTTKFLHPNSPPPADLRAEAELSLRQLGVDHVDSMLLHWHPAGQQLEPALEALARFQDDGKTRTIGVCNFPSAMLREALTLCPQLRVVQVEYHPFLSQDQLLDVVREHDLVLMAHSPLARGQVLEDEVIRRIADDRGLSVAQVALCWLVQQDRVAAIPGGSAKHRGHLAENLAALDTELTDAEMQRISSLARGVRVVDPPHAPPWDR
jgi:2,5-diketo-D-gluconate reductase B